MSQADFIPLLFLALLGLALGIGFMVLGGMLAVDRRNRLRQRPAIAPATARRAPARKLAGHPRRLAGGRAAGAGSGPHGAVLVGGRLVRRPRIFHQPARPRLGHRHRPRPALPHGRRGCDVSFSHGVEPAARPCAVFLREPAVSSSRLGAAGRRLRDTRLRVDGRDGVESGRQDAAGNQGGHEIVRLWRTHDDDARRGDEF